MQEATYTKQILHTYGLDNRTFVRQQYYSGSVVWTAWNEYVVNTKESITITKTNVTSGSSLVGEANGKIVCIYCSVEANNSSGGWLDIGSIPSVYRPTNDIYIVGADVTDPSNPIAKRFRVTAGGTIQVFVGTSGNLYNFTISYMSA